MDRIAEGDGLRRIKAVGPDQVGTAGFVRKRTGKFELAPLPEIIEKNHMRLDDGRIELRRTESGYKVAFHGIGHLQLIVWASETVAGTVFHWAASSANPMTGRKISVHKIEPALPGAMLCAVMIW